MARSISVKINTVDVISMIENKVADYKEQIATYPARMEAYKADRRAYTKKVAEKVSEIINTGGDNIFEDNEYADRISFSNSYSRISLDVGHNLLGDLGEAPKQPDSVTGHYSVTSKVQELEKTLVLLRLTPQETVTSSTYNSVLDLL